MEFKVKRDFLIIFLFNLLFAFLGCVAIPFAYNAYVFITVLAIVIALIVFYDTAVIFATCKVENKSVVYRAGAFKYDIKLDSIVKITKEKNLHPSLSPSMDRVRILTKENNKQKVYYLAVVDKKNFIDYLNSLIKKDEPKDQEVKKEKLVKNIDKTSNSKKTTTKKVSSAKKTTVAKKVTKE